LLFVGVFAGSVEGNGATEPSVGGVLEIAYLPVFQPIPAHQAGRCFSIDEKRNRFLDKAPCLAGQFGLNSISSRQFKQT
jgi:hypothetical protein